MQDPQFDVVVVGTDPHTTAVFGEFADFNRLRLVEAQASSIPGWLKKEWERCVILVLDDSIEHCSSLLTLVVKSRPSLGVIVVTPSDDLAYGLAIQSFNPLRVFQKPCDPMDVNRICSPRLIEKINEQPGPKIRRPTAEQFPLYCDRCGFDLSRAEFDERSGKREATLLTLAEVERRHICAVVAKLGGDKLKAAKVLGMGKTTLYRKLEEYGFGRTSDLPECPDCREVSEANDQLNQLTILKKQAQSMFEKMKQFERRIVGRG